MLPSTSSFRARDALLLVLLALLWGNSFLFIKTAVSQVPPAWLVVFRMALGALLVAPLAVGSQQRGPRASSTWAALLFIGVGGVGLGWMTQAWAQQFLDSGLVAVLNATTPVATLLIAVLFGQERLYANRVWGLALAVIGTLVVVGGEVQAGRSTLALFAAIASTFGYASATVMTRAHVSGRVTNQRAAAVQLAAGALLLGPVAMAAEGPPPLALELPVAASVLALGAFGTGLAFLIYFALVQRVGATNASMVTYLVPIVGLTTGALVRGERFGANVFAGAVAMIGGVWLAQRMPARSAPDGPSPSAPMAEAPASEGE